MAHESILIIEDEEPILELISYNLGKAGFRTRSAASGEEGLEQALRDPPDLVLLDIMLPGMDGLEVCRSLKREAATGAVPVIMLTAKGEEADVVSGLELGADDYIVKPFSPAVLVARIRSVLRRGRERGAPGDAPVRAGDLSIDPGFRRVTVRGKPVELTNMEFRVLLFLAAHPGWVYTRYQIISGARGEEYPVTDRSVDVMIVGLRRKLGPCGSYIETVRGVGYRFRTGT